MSQVAVIAGRTVADTARNAVGVVLVAVVGMVMGFRFASFGGAVLAVLLTIGMGYAFSWMGAAIAAKVRSPEMVGMLTMFWLFPLMMASSAFAPVESMPGWLQVFAEHQPISVASDAVRAWCEGTPAGADTVTAVLWMVGMLVVFVPWSTHLYRRAL